MDIQVSTIPQIVATFVLMGIGWMIRHCWRRYEKALVAAEKLRRQAAENQLTELKNVVAGLHTDISNLRREHEAMKVFLGNWARELTGNFSEQLKISQGDVEELRGTLDGLVEFFGAAKNNEKSSGIMVGKDMILIHRKEK